MFKWKWSKKGTHKYNMTNFVLYLSSTKLQECLEDIKNMKALITCNFLSLYSVKTLVFVFKIFRQTVSNLILILNGIISASITELWSHFSPGHTKHFQNAAVLWKI